MTLNNPTTPDRERLIAFFSNSTLCTYAVIGDEVGENGTFHLQCFFILPRSQRLSYLRTHVSDRAHFEPCRGTTQQNIDYCCKDGVFRIFGEQPGRGGTRTDLATVVTDLGLRSVALGRPITSPEVAQLAPVEYIRYPRLVRALFHRSDPIQLRTGEPREWQRELALELDQPADDRSVLFYVDLEGNTGKSWFIDWYYSRAPDRVQMMMPGKYADLAYTIDSTKNVVLFDIPRGGMVHLSYRLIESLKNRRVLSTKYQSQWKLFSENVHVVVFSNEHPDMTKLSQDRYILRGTDN
jgi:Putative viral replication protein